MHNHLPNRAKMRIIDAIEYITDILRIIKIVLTLHSLGGKILSPSYTP